MPTKERWHRLDAIPRFLLGTFPTPVRRLRGVEKLLGLHCLYLKNDGVCAVPAGGNKVRKLEYLLARARADGAQSVLTFGAAGSNHAATTALFAQQYGMKTIAVLADQPNSRGVARNLLLSAGVGARLVHCPDYRRMADVAAGEIAAWRAATGSEPFVIPPGGSSPLGTVGYVAAGFELAAQIAAGELEPPSRIYLPLGTCGTAVGLLLGLRAAGVAAHVVGVRVVPAAMANRERVGSLAAQVIALLHDYDPDNAECTLTPETFSIAGGQYGRGYGWFTRRGRDAMRMMYEQEGVRLEGTYTGKAFAALVDDACRGALRNERVLFVNTCNQHPVSRCVPLVDYRTLPPGFHRYFTEPVQALDSC